MRAIELVKFCDKILKSLSNSGIRTTDYRYVQMFDDYEQMLADGHKTTYIVLCLAERYKISERGVYRVLNRLKSPADI